MNLNPTSPSPILSPELNQLLTEHKQAETLASQWTARERELRQAIFNYCFPKPVEGTGNLYRLPFDKTLVGDYKINYMVDRGLLDAEIKKGLTSNVRPVIDKVISFDPKVRPGELKKLEREDLLLISPLQGGLANFFQHLGKPFESLWDDARRPQVTDELKSHLARAVEERVRGRSLNDLTSERNTRLRDVLSVAAKPLPGARE